MHVVTEYPDGIFSWVDLASSDVAAAKAFYQGLFGWESEDMFMPTDDGPVYIYTMFKLAGHNVAGLGPLPAEMQAQGVPSNWTSYVNHSDVDAIAEKITANGGTVIVPAMDVMDSGRMLMAMDPPRAVRRLAARAAISAPRWSTCPARWSGTNCSRAPRRK